MSLPKPLLMPAEGRDKDENDIKWIREDIAQNKLNDSRIHHSVGDLHDLYPSRLIELYDISTLGHYESSLLFANQIEFSHDVKTYLDIGCGSGRTTDACIMRLAEQTNPAISHIKVAVVDGIEEMVKTACRKLGVWMGAPPLSVDSIHHLVGDVFGELNGLRNDGPFDLITAQRVFIGCRAEERVQLLRKWASHLHEHGRLLVDIPHPYRHLSAIYIGPRSISPQAKHAQMSKCYQICDNTVIEDCCSYARELADAAGLHILNTMPAQIPPTAEEGAPIINTWLENTRASAIKGDLSDEERQWFVRRWAQDSILHYASHGFVAQVDVAAVIAVLGRGKQAWDSCGEVPS